MTEITAFAPGRVNLIGEHTDYNGGLALPFAIHQGVTVRGRQGHDGRLHARALDLGERDGFALSEPPGPARGWRAFVHGAAAELQRAGVTLPGADLTITGTVPRGGGLSSSAALGVALTLALQALAGLRDPPALEVAQTCARVESEWVGAQTGLLDQLASLLGREGCAVLLDFEALEDEPQLVPLDLRDSHLVLLDSGQRRALAGSGYNERRRECEEACRLLGVSSLRHADPTHAQTLPDPLNRRVRHVLTENDRVREAVRALEATDLPELGRLLDASHASLRDDYEISTRAVEAAVERCRSAGAIGARLMGGGFGGSVLALLPPGAKPPSGALAVSPGPGAHVEHA
ncbi:MAG TPA: galactokinase [Solirubrobacteraceae bacterium]|nr:galactokinase [Solirubrobacteraceae bacterium]